MGGAKLGALVRASIGHLSDMAAAPLFQSLCASVRVQTQSDIMTGTHTGLFF